MSPHRLVFRLAIAFTLTFGAGCAHETSVASSEPPQPAPEPLLPTPPTVPELLAQCEAGTLHVSAANLASYLEVAQCANDADCAVVSTRGCCTATYTAINAQFAGCWQTMGSGGGCRVVCEEPLPAEPTASCQAGICQIRGAHP